MFNREFFKKRQKLLLWLLNSWLTRKWFRYVLRIAHKGRIVQITPNSFTYDPKLIFDGKLKAVMKTDFRTHDKYSKRLFYAFRPLWVLCHYWDILTQFKPAWNLGFDLTFYPDANPESTSVDGSIDYIGTTQPWSAVRGSDGSTDFIAYPSSPELAPVHFRYSATNYFLSFARAYFLFDTSSMSDEATVSAATLSLQGTQKVSDGNALDPDINIYAGTPQSNTNLVPTDFNITRFGSTAFSTAITYNNWATDGYNDFALNSTGIAAIDVEGVSKFGARNANCDVADNGGGLGTSYPMTMRLNCYAADQAGEGSDPKLVITWSVIIAPSCATITLSGQVPTIVATITISPSNATITITGQVPTITKTGGWDIQTKHTTTWTAGADYVITGDGSPSPNGDYNKAGTYNSESYYERDDEAYAIWWDDGEEMWIISLEVGVAGDSYWYQYDDLEGTYTPVSCEGNPDVASGTKNTASWSEQSKNTASWTGETKH